jgi:hypothetical protein
MTAFSTPRIGAAALVLALAGAVQAQTVAAASGPALPQNAAQWRQAAIQDIEEATRLTRDNHPGAVDPANPAFLVKLDEARRAGLQLADKVSSAAGYSAALQRFNVKLGDGHAGMVPDIDSTLLPPERWPGFVAVWRGQGLYVFASVAGGPPAGAEVTACDGKPIRQVITDNLFAFNGRIDEPGHWWARGRRVFMDSGNPFIKLPARCRFTLQGKPFEQDLVWRANDDQGRRWQEEGYNGPTLPVGLSEPRRGLLWAALPTFQPDDRQRDAYRAMFRDIDTQRRRYLEADAVVIDLRANQGGSSLWSRDFASALWGRGRVERRMAVRSAKTRVWWRASKDNTAYLAQLADQLGQQKQEDAATWARRIHAGMQAALARGEAFYVEQDNPSPPAAAGDPDRDLAGDPPPFNKPVYVIVPGQCASACLDALDVFTRFANTTLIGAPSSADSTYMEVRYQKTGSGLATVIIPNKVYVNRARGNGEVYLPAIEVRDPVWSVETFLKVVEADLAKRR